MKLTSAKNFNPGDGSEAESQRQYFRWVRFWQGKYPVLAHLYHVPNGGKRDARTAADLVLQGVKPGLWDIANDTRILGGCFYTPLRGELKFRYNKLSEPQEAMLDYYLEQDFGCFIAYTWEEAVLYTWFHYRLPVEMLDGIGNIGREKGRGKGGRFHLGKDGKIGLHGIGYSVGGVPPSYTFTEYEEIVYRPHTNPFIAEGNSTSFT